MSAQLGLGLEGGSSIIPDRGKGELGAGDLMPPGPYSVGLTHWQSGDGELHDGPPWTVVCGDGRAIAGYIPSREIAEEIAAALNRRRST